jgi:MFS family permease
LTLVATILGSSIAILDSSVVSVALPSIQRSVGGGLAGQQWVSNAYLLTLGSLILLGDIFGERRVFALGVGGFGLTSLLCALAPTIGLLVAFRALQGVAGALLTPSPGCWCRTTTRTISSSTAKAWRPRSLPATRGC